MVKRTTPRPHPMEPQIRMPQVKAQTVKLSKVKVTTIPEMSTSRTSWTPFKSMHSQHSWPKMHGLIRPRSQNAARLNAWPSWLGIRLARARKVKARARRVVRKATSSRYVLPLSALRNARSDCPSSKRTPAVRIVVRKDTGLETQSAKSPNRNHRKQRPMLAAHADPSTFSGRKMIQRMKSQLS